MNLDLLNSEIKRQRYTKTFIANELKISICILLKILQGKQKKVDIQIAVKLSQILSIPLEQLIEGVKND